MDALQSSTLSSVRDASRDRLTAVALSGVPQSRGYGAITSRSVASEAGVKHQLVYYYFKDIDDLLLAEFKRRMDRGIERLRQDASAEHPVRAVFEDFSHAIDA